MFATHATSAHTNQMPNMGNTQGMHQAKTALNLTPNITQVANRVDSIAANSFLNEIETTPLLLSNHNLSANSLQSSVYELLQQAKKSILLISFTLTDPKTLQLLNQKAQEGVEVKLVVDQANLPNTSQLHPSIQLTTRTTGEGHLHHKVLVTDRSYVWLGSANFSNGSFNKLKNLAIACFSKPFAEAIHQEATHIVSQAPRIGQNPVAYQYGNQTLELYILPHNNPLAPEASASVWNNQGKECLLSLINAATTDIKISLDNWTLKEASYALIAAQNRGVNVEVVTTYFDGEAVQLLSLNGVKVKQGNQLHHKFMLIDDKHLLNGSPNWSMNMVSRSDESFFVLYDLTPVQQGMMHEILTSVGLSIPIVKATEITVGSSKLMNMLNWCMSQLKDTSAVALPVLNATANELQKKTELVNRAIKAINEEIKTMPSGQEGKRMVTVASKLASKLNMFIPQLNVLPVPGCCHYVGKNYLKNVVAIAEKQERIESALTHLKLVPSQNPKVTQYFLSTLAKLKKGENVPLPDFYHATRAGLASIINSQTILQSTGGLVGPGTYMSSNNEGNFGYGDNAFAIDEGCLAESQATTFTGRQPNGDVFYSLWAAVLKDIPVSEETIAFIDVADSKNPQESLAHVEKLLKQKNLNIPVMDRQTSDEILKIFDLSTKRREFPSFGWKKSEYLPKNMYPRSPEGTFRKFAPTM